jgi:hypothetical protein
MITTIILVAVVGAVAMLLKNRYSNHIFYPEKETEAKELIQQGDKNAAADVYLSILEEEYAREVPRATVITHYTDMVLPLLRTTGRVDDEMCVLRYSMSKCVMNTYKRSWNKWQKRLVVLDNLYPDR